MPDAPDLVPAADTDQIADPVGRSRRIPREAAIAWLARRNPRGRSQGETR